MRKDLTTTENTEVALSKSRSFMGVIKNIFNKKITAQDDSWTQRLWDWADENNVDGGTLPRNKKELLTIVGLDLSQAGLITLPKEIGNLTDLKVLNLDDNQLTELPKEIGNITNLGALVLTNNKLIQLPKEIGNLDNLLALDATGNQLAELPKEIGNLLNLTIFHVKGNQLKKLPNEIGNLANLTEFGFSDNRLTVLPKEIGNLTILAQLGLKNNQLTELPEEIISLTSLAGLYLYENPDLILTEKQKEWIDELEVDGCDVHFDNSAWEHSLNKIDIENDENDLGISKSHIDDINQNKFYELIEKTYARSYDLGVCFEHNISFESFVDNKLTWRNTAEGHDKVMLVKHWDLINLFVKELFGIGTEVVNIEDDGWMQRLWDWADENNIPDLELPRNKEKLLASRGFNFSEHKLKKLPKEIGNLTNLTELYLHDNSLVGLPKEICNLVNLTKLYLGGNQLTELSREICSITSLTLLNLKYSQLLELSKEIENLTNLTELNLEHNQLVELPKEISNLISLTALQLEGNLLTGLPEGIGNLISLLFLDLGGNQLLEIPKEIGGLNNLKILYLSNNKLMELPKEIVNLTSLSSLGLNANPYLILTKTQKKWLSELEKNGCNIYIDDDTWGREMHDDLPSEQNNIDDNTVEKDIQYEEPFLDETYNDSKFDAEQLTIAMKRSISEDSGWVFLHTNLNEAIEQLKNEEWENKDNSGQTYFSQFSDGNYIVVEFKFDNNGFPILRSGVFSEGETFEDTLEPYDKLASIEEPILDSNFEQGALLLTELLEKEASSREAVLEFILGELDGASQGSEYAINFVKKSGFKQEEYRGALTNASDEADAIHLVLHSALFGINDIDLRVKLSTSVLDNMMKKYSLGKYTTNKISYDQNKIIEFKDEIDAWVDKETGLMWEVKNIENVGHMYAWSKEWVDKQNDQELFGDNFKDAFSYTESLNSNKYAGFDDWRLPNSEELETLLAEEINEYYIKVPLCENTLISYWSCDTYANNKSEAIEVVFNLGFESYSPKRSGQFVRCVRKLQ